MIPCQSSIPFRFQTVNAHRNFSQCCDAEALAQAFSVVTCVVVADSRMSRYPVVPQRNSPIIPFHPSLDVLALRDMLQ